MYLRSGVSGVRLQRWHVCVAFIGGVRKATAGAPSISACGGNASVAAMKPAYLNRNKGNNIIINARRPEANI